MRVTEQSKSFCEMIKADGGKCQGRKIASSSYCFFHDPEKGAEREAAQKAGGLRNKLAVLSRSTPDARLLDAPDALRLVAETINQVRRGEIDPKVANTIGYLCSLFLKTLNETESERRLAALQRTLSGN